MLGGARVSTRTSAFLAEIGSSQKSRTRSIHGAKLPEHRFNSLSATRVAYQKTTRSVDLTKWLAENAPDDLADIADLITDVLDSPQAKLARASAP